jgi:hypothetical protein
MQLVRVPIAADPLSFGKAPKPTIQPVPPVEPAAAPRSMADDLRLFAMTFAAGFIFVSLFIA